MPKTPKEFTFDVPSWQKSRLTTLSRHSWCHENESEQELERRLARYGCSIKIYDQKQLKYKIKQEIKKARKRRANPQSEVLKSDEAPKPKKKKSILFLQQHKKAPKPTKKSPILFLKQQQEDLNCKDRITILSQEQQSKDSDSDLDFDDGSEKEPKRCFCNIL